MGNIKSKYESRDSEGDLATVVNKASLVKGKGFLSHVKAASFSMDGLLCMAPSKRQQAVSPERSSRGATGCEGAAVPRGRVGGAPPRSAPAQHTAQEPSGGAGRAQEHGSATSAPAQHAASLAPRPPAALRQLPPADVSDSAARLKSMVAAGQHLEVALAEHGNTREMIECLDPVLDGCEQVMWSMRPSQPHHTLGIGAWHAPCEPDRAETMRALRLLDLPDSPEIDNILRLVCNLYGAPCSAISLVSTDTCFIKQACGAAAGPRPWKIAYCPWILVTPKPDLLVLEDLTKDVRFADSFWCQNGMRTYVAAPMLASNGHRLGTLCFFSNDVLPVDSGKCRMLANLGEMAARELEKHAQLETLMKQNADVQQAYHKMLRSLDALNSPVVFVDAGSSEEWSLLYVTPAFSSITGIDRDAATSASLRDLLLPPGRPEKFWSALQGLRASGRAFTIKGVRLSLGGQDDGRDWDLSFRPAERDTVDRHTLPVGVPSAFAHISNDQRGHLYFATITEACPERSIGSSALLGGGGGGASANGRRVSLSQRAAKPGGLELRQLLGRGAHAAVYYGTWYGTEVAVKVMERAGMSPEEWQQVMTELEVGKDIVHPLIVRTLSYQVIKTDQVPLDCLGDTSDLESNLSGSHVLAWCSSASDYFTSSDINSTADTRVAIISHSSGSIPGEWTAPVHSLPHNSPGCSSTESLLPIWPVSSTPSATDVGSGDAASISSSACYSLAGSSSRRMSTRSTVDDTTVWLIMEYCTRGCLQDAIDKSLLRSGSSFYRDQPHRPKLQASALEVASAMRYLHHHGVTHGDLTTFNVLLAAGGPQADNAGRGWYCKVADFGCSQRLGPADLLRVNSYGSVSHMAPEVLQHSVISKAADVYSFGVLMWQMWCAVPPWAGLRHVQIMHAVVHEKQMLEFPKNAWPPYKALACRCMSYDATDRPTFEEVCEALEQMRAVEEDVVGSF